MFANALSQQGHRITVPTRRLPARSVQMLPGVEVVRADVHDPAQLVSLVSADMMQLSIWWPSCMAMKHAFDHVHVQLTASPCSTRATRKVCIAWCISVLWEQMNMQLRCTSAAKRGEKKCCKSLSEAANLESNCFATQRNFWS
jgi:hypothetical protein